MDLSDIIEDGVPFDKDDALRLIPQKHLDKLTAHETVCATGYRRTRHGKQQLEVRDDGIAGCLRTPEGGSNMFRKTVVAITLAVSCLSLQSVPMIHAETEGNTGIRVRAAAEATAAVTAGSTAAATAANDASATPAPTEITDLGGVKLGDVVSVSNGTVKIKYQVTSLTERTVKVCSGASKTAAVNEKVNKSVVIPEKINCKGYSYSVTAIGAYAFYNCALVPDVTFSSENIKTIGKGAFQKCKAIKRMVLPAGVTKICANAFRGCTGINDLSYSNIAGSKLKTIEKNAFYGCRNITTFGMPEKVASIGNKAFYNCIKLSEFYSVNLESGTLKTIGESAFAGCSSLARFVVPGSVTSIGSMAFYGCGSMKTVIFNSSENLTGLGEAAFYKCASLTSIALPGSLTDVSKGTFYGCSALKKVTIQTDAKIKSIGEMAFYGCEMLKKFESPKNVTKIRKFAFSGCKKLKTVSLNSGVTAIAEKAFASCPNLRSIEIPATVTKINRQAFNGHGKKLIIYGDNNSKAAKFAKKNKITFDILSAKDLESVSLSVNNINLPVGREYTIKLKYNPSKNVRAAQKTIKWTSSVSGIVSFVSKANQTLKIKGMRAGSTVITAKSGNGKTATCTVKVS